MPRLRATFHFRLRWMGIDRSLLGSSHEGNYGDYRVELTFPMEDHLESTREYEIDRSTFPDLDELPAVKGGGVRFESMYREPSDSFATVVAVRVCVMFERAGVVGQDNRDLAMSYLKDANVVAKTVVSSLVDRVRVDLMQPWLGLSGAEVEVGTVSTLEDLDAGHRLPVTLGFGKFVMREYDRFDALEAERLKEFLASHASTPPLAESLMTDALFYSGAADPPDLPRAVLISAIACELKVKDVLRSLVHDDALRLLEWLLESPRDHSIAAVALFDKGMGAIAGKSLRDEDRELYDGVRRLFELRNRIAHRGELPDEQEARNAVENADRAIKWLGDVQ